MPKLKKRPLVKNLLKNRKKHVETMFLTNKQKTHPFYYKRFLLVNNGHKIVSPKRGLFYLRSLDFGLVGISELKSIARLSKWFIKKNKLDELLRFKILLFPDFSLTSKPKDVRMGKGKGSVSHKVSIVNSSRLIYSLKTETDDSTIITLTQRLLKLVSSRLSVKTIITTNNW